MPNPTVTAALTQAGIRLLSTLVDRVLDYGEEMDTADYVILEGWLLEALEQPERIEAAMITAQKLFNGQAGAYARSLELFTDLIEYAGEACESFTENLWRAYLFRSQYAADMLWDQYPELQRTVLVEKGHHLPGTWGDWVLPMQMFMGIVEQCLADQNPTFEELFSSEELLMLIERLPVQEVRPESAHGPEISFTSGGDFDQTTLTAYLTACVRRIGQIDPRGYPRSIHTTVPLNDVFIPLRLIPLHEYDQPRHYARYRDTTYDDPELRVFHEPLGYRELETLQGVTFSEVLTRHRQLLILGENGTGKTTLLRHLVFEYARILLDDQAAGMSADGHNNGRPLVHLVRPLPIYVDLAEYVEDRGADETLEHFILRAAADLAQDDSAASLLDAMLRAGQCIVLLDGLDQVATEEQRRLLVAETVDASSAWCAEGNQVVVTSRFAGYDITPLPREFGGYLIRPLDRSQINAFLLRWKLSLAGQHRPLMGREEVLRQVQLETLDLSRQIASNPRLQVRINTPLLLRMLVGVYRPGMLLTPQRVTIYQLVAEALIREWRLPQSDTGTPAVLEHEVVPLLGELAFWLQASRPAGVLSERELREILGNIWSGLHPDASHAQVHDAIGRFIGTLRVHSGVLVELAPERYGFIYQGLQEYFAARYLVSSYRLAAERIREHLHDPRWEEVIMLGIGFTSLRSRDDASDLIEAAVLARGERAVQFGHASSPFESLLKRDLFCAARLLGSGVEARSEITRTVVRQLMDLWLWGDRDSLGRFNLVFDSARRHLINLDGTSASRMALQIAMEHLDAPNEYVQAYAVDALTFWTTHLAEAQKALVEQNRKMSLMVRRAAAGALGRMGPLSKEAYALLLNLTADVDEQVSTVSQQVLERLPPVPYESLTMWVEFLNSEDPVRRRVALRRLQEIGSLPPVVIGELLRLMDDPDAAIRQRAVETLAGVSQLTDDALTVICRSIADADPRFRAAAIHAFARPVELPPQVLTQLIRWSGDPDASVRLAAIRALGICRNNSRELIGALIERLEDVSDSIRAAAVEPLVLKARDYQDALHMLVHVVRDPFYQVRRAVAYALRYIPDPNIEMQSVLYQLMSDREMIVRETTLDTVGRIQNPGSEIVDYLVSIVTMPDHPLRANAVKALASLRGLPHPALLALVYSLQVYREALGTEIVDCLRAHTPLHSEIISQVMDLAVDHQGGPDAGRQESAGLRVLAFEILGYALDDAHAVVQILLEAAQQSDSIRVRAAALRGLAHLRVMPPSVLNTLYDLLEHGPLEVRCAAGVALGHLIRNLPDPPLGSDDLLEIARALAGILSDLPPLASWESQTQTQNEMLWALSWVVARARPTVPRLADGLENTRRYFDEQSGDWQRLQ